MRCTNLRLLTYLLTYLHTNSSSSTCKHARAGASR